MSFHWQGSCEVLSCEPRKKVHLQNSGSLMLLLEVIFEFIVAEAMKIAAALVARAQDLQLA